MANLIHAQQDSVNANLSFNGDFRFRVEQDWNSKNADGSLRDDRTRMRYRLRAGAEYRTNWYVAGFKLRTGDPRKQQDPQLTLGTGVQEFGTLPIGLEKAFFKAFNKTAEFWLGKNQYPFKKNNELFWSDNVFPEGVYISKKFNVESSFTDTISMSAGHFIVGASGKALENDTYFQAYQLHVPMFNSRLQVFPSFYYFRKMPNIPDGSESFELDYSILHFGSAIQVTKKPLIKLEFDYYQNMQDYSKNDSIEANFENQKTGYVLALK